MCGVLTQELGCQTNQVVKTSGCLQRCRCSYYRGNNQHNIDGYLAWMHAEDKHQYEHTHHSVDTQSDTAYPGTNEDKGQYDKQLE